MIRLIGAELNRLRSRRLTLILALAVIAVVALFQVAVVQAVTPPSAADVAAAQAGYEQDHQEWVQNHDAYVQQCLDSGGTEDQCTYPEPTKEQYGLTPATFGSVVGAGVSIAVVVAMLAGYLVAASSIGAEYSTGALGNWLTFVPRREQVYAAKVAALAIGSAALGLVAGGLMVGLAAIVTSVIGQPLTGAGAAVATAGRGIPVVVFASLIGFCIAMLTRHTVAALGALVGYGLLVLGLTIVSYLITPISLLKPWQIETNVRAFLNHGQTYAVYERVVTAQGVNIQSVERTLGFGAASAYLAVVLAVFLVVTLLVFRRRDVT